MVDGKLSLLGRFIDTPKKVFLIDALGALVTSIILFGVVAQLEYYFGMPRGVVYLLSAIAFCIFIYSISCYQFVTSKWKVFFVIIIGCNIGYVLVSIFLINWYIEQITQLGLSYFILELIVILIVICVEYKSYSKLS